MDVDSITKWVVALLLSGGTAFLSGYVAAMGAGVGGVEAGGWNLQFIPFLLGGWIGGFVFACISFLAVRGTYAKFVLAIVGPPVAAFVLSAAIAAVMSHEDRAKNAIAMRKYQEWRMALILQLRRDPEIALSEEWHRKDHADVRWDVLYKSLAGNEIRFSSDQLKRLNGADREISIRILESPSADAEFLRGCIEGAIKSAESRNSEFIKAIVANPNTPDAVLERVLHWSETRGDDSIAKDVGEMTRKRLSGVGGK